HYAPALSRGPWHRRTAPDRSAAQLSRSHGDLRLSRRKPPLQEEPGLDRKRRGQVQRRPRCVALLASLHTLRCKGAFWLAAGVCAKCKQCIFALPLRSIHKYTINLLGVKRPSAQGLTGILNRCCPDSPRDAGHGPGASRPHWLPQGQVVYRNAKIID